MPSTQHFLQFDHIRDDVIVMRNSDFRAILMVSAINFGLKSQEEQDAIIYAYQGFLNALDFDLQIMVHSRKMDISPYLEDLAIRAERQENELLRSQTEEYIEFIRSFVSESNVMSKQFYLVVPFSLLTTKEKTSGILSAVGTFFSRRSVMVEMSDEQFATHRSQAAGLADAHLVSGGLADARLLALKVYGSSRPRGPSRR